VSLGDALRSLLPRPGGAELRALRELAARGEVDLRALLAKAEAEAATSRRREALRTRELARLRATPTRKLHLGCGAHPMDGWTNVDGGDGVHFDPPADPRVIELDVFDALAALPDASVDFVHSEQFLEHFTRQDGFQLLRECARVVRPGGVVRTQVPDLHQVVKLYLDEVEFAPWATVQYPHRMRNMAGGSDPYGKLIPGEQYLPAMMINNGFHMDGHRFLYDYETLAQVLRLAGFSHVERCEFGHSRHTALHGIDHHDGGETGRSWVPKVALTVESTK
jgi:predicted SAM-dependent methyltransferase